MDKMPPMVLDEYGSAASAGSSEESVPASVPSAAPATDVTSGMNVMGDLLDTDAVAPIADVTSSASAGVDLMSDLFGTGGDPSPTPSAPAPELLQQELPTSIVAYEKNNMKIVFELEKRDDPYLVTITAVTTAPQLQIHNFLLQVRLNQLIHQSP